MHRAFRKALEDAQGRSELVIVVFADIRGFSAFSQSQDSANVAMYIKRVYMRLIDNYFSFASFYKPTGDGLLITVPYKEDDLQQKAQTTVSACLLCLQDFPSICADDPMINFQLPTQIGFGLTRGPACCLMSCRRVLDYSGHMLNLASRLKDLARPSGIILDGGFGTELLSEEQQQLFEAADVFIPRVAEDQPHKLYFLKNVVQIPDQAKHQIAFEHWEAIKTTKTFGEWRSLDPPSWIVILPKRPRRPDALSGAVTYPVVKRGKKPREFYQGPLPELDYVDWAGIPQVYVRVAPLCQSLRQRRVPLKTPVTVTVAYVPE